MGAKTNVEEAVRDGVLWSKRRPKVKLTLNPVPDIFEPSEAKLRLEVARLIEVYGVENAGAAFKAEANRKMGRI